MKKAKRVKHSGQTKAFHLTNQKDAREFILVVMQALQTIIHLYAGDIQVNLYAKFTSNCLNHLQDLAQRRQSLSRTTVKSRK